MSKKKEENKTVEIRRIGQCETIPQLKKFLEKSDTATAKVDRLLMEGGKLSELLDGFNEVRGESNDFRTKSKMTAHIKYRHDVNGWQFQYKDEDSDNPYVRLKKIA